MKKILEKQKLQTFFTILVVIFMAFMPTLELIGTFLGKKFFYQEKILSIFGLILSCFIILLIIINLIINRKLKLTLSDLFIITSIIFCLISIIFSKNMDKSLHGEYGYSETPFQVLGYFSLFVVCSMIVSEKNRKIILNTFIFLGIFECLIAFLQNFLLWPASSLFDSYSHISGHMAFGLTEHCNYFAALAIIFTAVFSGNFIYSDKKDDLLVYLLLSIVGCFSCLFTYTRIAIVGIFAIIFGFIILNLLMQKFNKNKIDTRKCFKKIFILAISFIICFTIIEFFTKSIHQEISNSTKELNSDFNDFGTKRGTIWKVGLSSLKYYPLTGVGFDNYRYSFYIYPEKFGWSQNKGHNEYIHTLVTQGIPSGINYIIFCFWCCFFPLIKILKGESEFAKSNLTKIFLIALFAYFAQALFNSSVTNVAPYKWILMGLLLPRTEQKNLFEMKKKTKN